MKNSVNLPPRLRAQPLPVNFGQWPVCMQRRFRENIAQGAAQDRPAR